MWIKPSGFASTAIRGTLLLGQFLDAGITAVRDVGTRNDVALQIKEAVDRQLVDGPWVLWSGQLIASRGGHGDEITSTATGRPKSLEGSSRVRVANGPAGGFYHTMSRRFPADYYVELGFLKDAGLSDRDILASATHVGAQILGMSNKLGTLEKGKLADILMVGKSPLTDIQNLKDVRHVIADGRLVR